MRAFKYVIIFSIIAASLVTIPTASFGSQEQNGADELLEEREEISNCRRMADLSTCVPIMDWSGDVAATFKLFRQKCELYFKIKDIKNEDQVN